MSDWLLLRLPQQPGADASWLLLNAHGVAQGATESGNLATAATQAAGRRICVLVPAVEVLATEVDLPVKGGTRALQAAPFALEELLIGDIELQHFAVGERDPLTGRTQVAVVARARMDAWLEELRAAGLAPQLLCSEASLLPSNPAQSLALLDAQTLTARPPGAATSPRTVPALPLPEALRVALDSTPLADVELLLQVTDEAWELHQSAIDSLRPQLARLAVQQLRAGLLPWLGLQLPDARPINLLQGSYQLRDSRQELWRRWRLAAAMAAALIMLSLASQAFTLNRLRTAERIVDVALADLAAQVFPGNSSTANLRRRVQALVAAQGSSDTQLLLGLQSLAGAVGGNATMQALSFRDGRIELKLRANDAQAIERIVNALKTSGWTAQLVSGGPANGGYEGRLQMQRSGERA